MSNAPAVMNLSESEDFTPVDPHAPTEPVGLTMQPRSLTQQMRRLLDTHDALADFAQVELFDFPDDERTLRLAQLIRAAASELRLMRQLVDQTADRSRPLPLVAL